MMNAERQVISEDRQPPTDSQQPQSIIHRLSFIRRSVPSRYALSALSGILLFLSFPLTNWTFLVWVACLPLLLSATNEPRLGRAYLLGALAGAIFLAGSVYWFTGVMEHYGNLSSVVALVVMVLFLVVVSSFWGAFALAEAWMTRRSPALALALSPFLWVSLELARTYYFFTGFPWNLLGYAVGAEEGLRQIASVTAVYGLSFLAVVTSALMAGALCGFGRGQRSACGFALLIWLTALWVANRALRPGPLPPAGNVAVLVQPNIPLNQAAESWAPWRDRAPLDRLVTLSVQGLPQDPSTARGAPLIVWSENSAPFYFNRDPVFRTAVEDMARAGRAYVLVGTTNFSGPGQAGPRNSAVVLDPSGNTVLQYDKIHLVPFGEYVPAWLSSMAGKITSQVGDFVPGSNYGAAQTPEGKIGVFICYEAIFPQLVRRLTPRGRGVLVNISDDAWYGDSSAASQSLEMARLRAVENHRYLLRATNDGITALIDPYGRVIRQLPRHQQAVLPVRFSYVGEQTFYNGHGDVFAWVCLIVTGVVLAVTGRRRTRSHSIRSFQALLE